MVENDELYHFGVKGMKWGVRKTVREVKEANKRNKDFNKNDRYILFNLGKGSIYAKRRNHLEKKLSKTKRKRTISKYEEKIGKYDTKSRKYLDLASKGKEKSEQMINDAKKRGEILKFNNATGKYYFAAKIDKESKKHVWTDNSPDYTDKYSDTYDKMIKKNYRNNS